MAYRLTPYAYRPGDTFLHRLSGGIKLLGLFLISITAFFPGPGSVIAALLIILGAISAGIRPWELLRGSRSIVVMALLVIVLRTIRFTGSESGFPEFSRSGFTAGILFGAGIMLSFSAGALLFSVTTMMELRDSLDNAQRSCLLKILKKSGKSRAVYRLEESRISRLSLGISLMLGFLPRFFEIWEDADCAYQARAGKKGIPKIFLLIPIVTERMIEIALETATALESRGVSL